jgi:transposase
MSNTRNLYPSDVTDEDWTLVAPYLVLLPEDAGQRSHPLREVFNGLCYIIKTGAPWRWMPNDLPPWVAVYQQAQRWLAADCFEALVEDLRAMTAVSGWSTCRPMRWSYGGIWVTP